MSLKPQPKILAAGIATLIVLVGEVANQLTGLYPNNALVNELPFLIPVIVGYLQKEESTASPVVLQTATPEPIPTLPAVPNANVPVAPPVVQNAPVEPVSDASVYPPPIAK